MGRVRRVVRWVLVGRRDGLRARIRERLGLFSWLDRRSGPQAAPSEDAPKREAGRADDAGWVEAVEVGEIPEGEVVEVVLDGRGIALVNIAGEVHAVSDTCPHAGGALGEGYLDGTTLTCPLHGWTFDATTGECHIDPEERLERFDVEVRGSLIFVRVG